MNQIISWVCLISICFLALQVMIFVCEDTLKIFNKVSFDNKSIKRKVVVTRDSYIYKNKMIK